MERAALRDDVQRHLIIRETTFAVEQAGHEQRIQSIYGALAGEGARNELILDDIISPLEEGRSPLVLTERRDRLDEPSHHLKASSPRTGAL